MRTKRGADALFPRTRKEILSALVMNPKRSWFLSDLARHLRSPKTSLQRELANLEGAGIILREVEGRQVYYRANPACPFLPELQGLLAKTAGLVDVIRDGLRSVKRRIEVAFLYGSVAKGEEVAESDVDLMVVGTVGLSGIALAIRRIRERLSREVNPTVFTSEEFRSKAREGGFVRGVLDKPKLFVVGSEDDLERTLGPAPGRKGSRDQRRDRGSEAARSTRDRRRVG
jgi:DNA-binding transcriptional ArsR family regulator